MTKHKPATDLRLLQSVQRLDHNLVHLLATADDSVKNTDNISDITTMTWRGKFERLRRQDQLILKVRHLTLTRSHRTRINHFITKFSTTVI